MTDKNRQSENGNRQFNDEICERYLLGELSEAEQEEFEAAYFADDALFEQFLAVKEELLDASVRGELAEEQQARFDQHFLATEPRRLRAEESKKFVRAVTAFSEKAAPLAVIEPVSETTEKTSWWQLFTNFINLRPLTGQVALAAGVLMILVGLWFFVRQWQSKTDEEQAIKQPPPTPTSSVTPIKENVNLPANDNSNTGSNRISETNIKPPSGNTNKSPANINKSPVNTTPVSSPTPKTLIDQPPPNPTLQVASIMLLPVMVRSVSPANTLRLSSETRTVRLGLAFKSGDYRKYSAAVTTIAGATVWQQNNLKSAGKSITLQFAPALLRGQDYLVILKGQTAEGQTETIAEYYFRVDRTSTQKAPSPPKL